MQRLQRTTISTAARCATAHPVQHRTRCIHSPFSSQNILRGASSSVAHIKQRGRSCLQVCNSRRKQSDTPYKKVTTIRFNEREVNVPTDNLWLLAIPAAAFVAVSALLGPLVIGIAFSAIAIGAAFTAGTVALAFPFLFLIFFMPLVFGGLSFTGMVTFGVLSIIPKIIALVIAGTGVALGWGAVNLLRLGQQGGAGKTVVDVEEEEDETEEERVARELFEDRRQRARELREFDELLEGKDRRDRWRP